MKTLFLSLLTLSSVGLAAQFGISGYYQNFTATEWETVLGNMNPGKESLPFVRQGFRVGVDYWLKPFENTRIILMPELSYSRSEESSFTQISPFVSRSYQYHSAGLSLPVNIYLFDLEGDCDCPTWSKSEPFFKKGLFLQVMPGGHFNRYRFQRIDDDQSLLAARSTDINFSLGAGAGLDVGLSDLITLSPTVRYVYHFDKWWGNLDEIGPLIDPSPDYSADPAGWEVGIRLGIRLDY